MATVAAGLSVMNFVTSKHCESILSYDHFIRVSINPDWSNLMWKLIKMISEDKQMKAHYSNLPSSKYYLMVETPKCHISQLWKWNQMMSFISMLYLLHFLLCSKHYSRYICCICLHIHWTVSSAIWTPNMPQQRWPEWPSKRENRNETVLQSCCLLYSVQLLQVCCKSDCGWTVRRCNALGLLSPVKS